MIEHRIQLWTLMHASQLLTALNTNKIFIKYTGKSLINFGCLTSKCKKTKILNFLGFLGFSKKKLKKPRFFNNTISSLHQTDLFL